MCMRVFHILGIFRWVDATCRAQSRADQAVSVSVHVLKANRSYRRRGNRFLHESRQGPMRNKSKACYSVCVIVCVCGLSV